MAEADRISIDPQFRNDVLAGLSSSPKAIPARWFYDQRGSELFDDITRLPEYYPTRVETDLLVANAANIAERTGTGGAMVEFGSGSSTKTPLLLKAVCPEIYIPIDISGAYLRESAARLARGFPNLAIHPIEADFLSGTTLPTAANGLAKLGFFPGSTIGNMVPYMAVDLLRGMIRTLGAGAKLLIGMDRIKAPDVLIAAYDDSAGVTAAFNLNVLERINRELDGTIPIDAFEHRAIWNATSARIEMHLMAMRDCSFEVGADRFDMAQGETLHTENSHKYGPRDARLLLECGGWSPIAEWVDDIEQFALILAQAQPQRLAP